jgi:hypothetical protein
VSYQVNWEILALDQAAGFLRDDPAGVVAQASYRKASRGRRPGEFAEGRGYLRVAMMRETVTRTAAQDYGGDAHQEPFLACLSRRPSARVWADHSQGRIVQADPPASARVNRAPEVNHDVSRFLQPDAASMR